MTSNVLYGEVQPVSQASIGQLHVLLISLRATSMDSHRFLIITKRRGISSSCRESNTTLPSRSSRLPPENRSVIIRGHSRRDFAIIGRPWDLPSLSPLCSQRIQPSDREEFISSETRRRRDAAYRFALSYLNFISSTLSQVVSFRLQTIGKWICLTINY